MKRLLTLNILLIILFHLNGQEYLTGFNGLPYNQGSSEQQAPTLKSYIYQYPPLNLPFFDDFTNKSIYPDHLKWIDDHTFVNDNYGIFPPNRGTITFDVLNNAGEIYNSAGTFSNIADYLTSYPIRLDSVFNNALNEWVRLTPADSVYLSFWFQPQGNGLPPSKDDSLVLDFGYYIADSLFSRFDSSWVYMKDYIAPDDTIFPGSFIIPPQTCDSIPYFVSDTLFHNDSILVPCDSVFMLKSKWTTVWAVRGDSLETFLDDNNSYFKLVMFPITDTTWFRADFQFRFKNYASISSIPSWKSNTDQWNIDCIYLNYQRSKADTNLSNIRFASTPPSFIKEYTSIPYRHYMSINASAMNDDFPLTINNLDEIMHNCTYKYKVVRDETDTLQSFNFPGLNGDIFPGINQLVPENLFYSYPSIISYFPFNPTDTRDSVSFQLIHIVLDNEGGGLGDTVIYRQDLNNYYAYDDGSAEAGYGLSPAGAQLAYQFRVEEPDTLRAVKIYFNRTAGLVNQQYFSFAIWNDNNGKPGNIIYLEENFKPEFPDGINNFYTYYLKNDSITFGIGNYYFGWIQTTNHNLNVGFDRNTDSRSKIFYNVSGSWVNSSYIGSLMIRPVFGSRLKEPEQKIKFVNLKVYPNPVHSDKMLYISLPTQFRKKLFSDLEIRIYDLFGRAIAVFPFHEAIDVSAVGQGLYIVSIIDMKSGASSNTKLIIN